MIITSRDNLLLRQARKVRDGKAEDLIFIEGLRLCEEAMRSALTLEAAIFSDELARKERAAPVVAELTRVCERVASVSEKLLESISYTKTPQGIVVLAHRPATSEAHLSEMMNEPAANSASPRGHSTVPLVVVMHQINNPANVGAILRTAEAAGATGAITTRNTTDPFSPKALRGAMGSAFRLPIWNGASYHEAIGWCDRRNIFSVCADARASSNYTDVDWRRPCALILGPESAGLAPEEISAASETVRIPMDGLVESLNVSVAAGILLYEAVRQRQT